MSSGSNRYNQYARRPWEAGYVGQYGHGRRYWDSDVWRRGRHQGGLSVYQEDDWRPPAWDEVPEMEPQIEQEEEEEEEEDECDWMCTQERMQELAREQERLQEERRVREQQRREEERSPAGQREAADVADGHQVEEVPELYPDSNWDSEGNRRMREWRQRQEQEQEERRYNPVFFSCFVNLTNVYSTQRGDGEETGRRFLLHRDVSPHEDENGKMISSRRIFLAQVQIRCSLHGWHIKFSPVIRWLSLINPFKLHSNYLVSQSETQRFSKHLDNA